MYLNLGNTSLRELEEFHYFREGFEYLYFCPRCCRNFESLIAVNNCKSCNGAVRLLQHKEKKKQKARKYNYFCEKCGKIESEKRVAECPTCKGILAPIYKWNELNLVDRMSVWISKMAVPSSKKSVSDSSHRERKRYTEQFSKLRLSLKKTESPVFFKKNDEELPTSSSS